MPYSRQRTRNFEKDFHRRVHDGRLQQERNRFARLIAPRRASPFSRGGPQGRYGTTTTSYTYDNRRRLWTDTAGGVTDTWGYDYNGNRTSDARTGTDTVYNAYNAADELCWAGSSAGSCSTPPSGATTYSYDGNGNTTAAGATTQSYNVFNQFTSNVNGGTTTNFTYAGPRNDERLTSGSTSFLNGTLGITQQTSGGATTSFIRDPQGNLISMRTSAGSFYYTTDALGSIILLTDSAQAKAATYSYDSWGNATSSGTQAGNNPWQYAGGYYEASTNRIKIGARYYNPYRGRFTQPDPSGQETNRYLYAGANPLNNTDPTGMDLLGTVFAAVLSAPVAAVGTTAVCTLTGGVGCLVGAALFGAFAGAAIAGANAGTNGATVDEAGQETLFGAVGGALTGFFGKLF